MSTLHSHAEPIGVVFTPLKWARWLVERFDLASRWAAGATICDPTAGKGVFVHALLDTALASGINVTAEMLSRLMLVERDPRFLSAFESGFRFKYGLTFPKANLICADIILQNPKRKFDLLVGNPPWINFCDLPEKYKAATKAAFVEYGLVGNRRSLLLGNSRVDLAALVIAVVLNENLATGGEAAFFLPLSLFLNDGAHDAFRCFKLKSSSFCVKEVWDFKSEKIFPDILTRFGAARFKRDDKNQFPIPYHVLDGTNWSTRFASSVHQPSGPWSVFDTQEQLREIADSPQISIRPEQQPRQGVNTCGANGVFIFDRRPEHLPSRFVYPLITKECFRSDRLRPIRFILLPYDPRTGRPLTEPELKTYPSLWNYLLRNKAVLENRKGMLLGAWLRRGIWWACLGVGPYTFAPHKIVWEAYGKSAFCPRKFSTFGGQLWQPNQAMHSFIPCSSEEEAEFLLAQLRSSNIEKYLRSMNMDGTCNWAQPGRIKRFLNLRDTPTIHELELGLAQP